MISPALHANKPRLEGIITGKVKLRIPGKQIVEYDAVAEKSAVDIKKSAMEHERDVNTSTGLVTSTPASRAIKTRPAQRLAQLQRIQPITSWISPLHPNASTSAYSTIMGVSSRDAGQCHQRPESHRRQRSPVHHRQRGGGRAVRSG